MSVNNPYVWEKGTVCEHCRHCKRDYSEELGEQPWCRNDAGERNFVSLFG